MEIVIRYTPDCPNLDTARERLDKALQQAGLVGADVRVEVIAQPDDAERLAFHGSPSFLIDGEDPFAEPGAPIGFGCRFYVTPVGRDTVPTVEQIRDALRRPKT
jgi:hypothetical protein